MDPTPDVGEWIKGTLTWIGIPGWAIIALLVVLQIADWQDNLRSVVRAIAWLPAPATKAARFMIALGPRAWRWVNLIALLLGFGLIIFAGWWSASHVEEHLSSDEDKLVHLLAAYQEALGVSDLVIGVDGEVVRREDNPASTGINLAADLYGDARRGGDAQALLESMSPEYVRLIPEMRFGASTIQLTHRASRYLAQTERPGPLAKIADWLTNERKWLQLAIGIGIVAVAALFLARRVKRTELAGPIRAISTDRPSGTPVPLAPISILEDLEGRFIGPLSGIFETLVGDPPTALETATDLLREFSQYQHTSLGSRVDAETEAILNDCMHKAFTIVNCIIVGSQRLSLNAPNEERFKVYDQANGYYREFLDRRRMLRDRLRVLWDLNEQRRGSRRATNETQRGFAQLVTLSTGQVDATELLVGNLYLACQRVLGVHRSEATISEISSTRAALDTALSLRGSLFDADMRARLREMVQIGADIHGKAREVHLSPVSTSAERHAWESAHESFARLKVVYDEVLNRIHAIRFAARR